MARKAPPAIKIALSGSPGPVRRTAEEIVKIGRKTGASGALGPCQRGRETLVMLIDPSQDTVNSLMRLEIPSSITAEIEI